MILCHIILHPLQFYFPQIAYTIVIGALDILCFTYVLRASIVI